MKRWVVIILFTIYFVLSGCQKNNEIVNEPNLKEVPASGAEIQSSRDNGKSVNVMQGRKIYLYGEKHAVESILNKEFDLWPPHALRITYYAEIC